MDDVGQKKLKQDLALYQNDELENDSLLFAHIFEHMCKIRVPSNLWILEHIAKWHQHTKICD